MDTSDDPNWITTYRGVILSKQLKKWVKLYEARRGGVQPIAIFEDIIQETFSHKPCDSCTYSCIVSFLTLICSADAVGKT